MEKQYHFAIKGKDVGPLDETQLRQRISRGEITAATQAWREGMPDWKPAGDIPELKDLLVASGSSTVKPPLPGATPSAQQTSSSASPANLTPLEEKAYQFVMGVYRPWRGKPSSLRAYVEKNPKRALPVAAATLGILLLVIAMTMSTTIDNNTITNNNTSQNAAPMPPSG